MDVSVYKALGLGFAIALLIFGLAFAITFYVLPHRPMNETDASPRERSGMTVHRDAVTGCQYVSRFLGGMTPRLDAAGKPMCGR